MASEVKVIAGKLVCRLSGVRKRGRYDTIVAEQSRVTWEVSRVDGEKEREEGEDRRYRR